MYFREKNKTQAIAFVSYGTGLYLLKLDTIRLHVLNKHKSVCKLGSDKMYRFGFFLYRLNWSKLKEMRKGCL